MKEDQLLDQYGEPFPADREEKVREAYRLLKDLTEEERRLVLRWFCRECYRYVGPGDSCYCSRDD